MYRMDTMSKQKVDIYMNILKLTFYIVIVLMLMHYNVELVS